MSMRTKCHFLLFCTFLLLLFSIKKADCQVNNQVEGAAVQIVPLLDYSLKIVEIQKQPILEFTTSQPGSFKTSIIYGKEPIILQFTDNKAQLKVEEGINFLNTDCNLELIYVGKRDDGVFYSKKMPLWLSLLPPLIAILLALIFREVIVSLFTGVLVGAFVASGMGLGVKEFFMVLWSTITKYVTNALTDSSHVQIIVFSLMIGGMVAIISRNGGMAGVVQKLSKLATSAKRSQLITWLLGLLIFFDDYANTLIVGNTMRATTDRFKVSREKLAYIVDSTAAPVSSLAFITTWIGFEIGQIEAGFAGLKGVETPTAYSAFLNSLEYSFYPVLTLIFIVMIILMDQDFGPMYKAEIRARKKGIVAPQKGKVTREGDVEDLSPIENAPLRWYNAIIPVLGVIFVTIYGLMETGMEGCHELLLEKEGLDTLVYSWTAVWENLDKLYPQGGTEQNKLGTLVGNADSYTALLWASFSGLGLAILLTIGGRIMGLVDTMNTMMTGFKSMLPAVVILVLAWSLAEITGELHTADFLACGFLGKLNPYMLPVVIFVLAALISFSTGSSWGTMAILYPIAIPITWQVCSESGIPLDTQWEIMYNVIATVLAASVVGDHCSPISDTTILSSLATDCNHIEHVRTQLPYALLVGVVSMIIGYFATLLGTPYLLNIGVGIAVLYGVIKVFGRKIDG